jgi:hypothetical protein
MSRPEALRRARNLRAKFRDERDEFTQSEYHAALAEACADLSDSALEGLVAWAAEAVDKDATRGAADAPGQQSLDFDLEGEEKLGAGRRIARRKMRRDHAAEALALKRANLQSVQQALARDEDELARLTPFWRAHMTKEEAVAAYRDAGAGAA